MQSTAFSPTWADHDGGVVVRPGDGHGRAVLGVVDDGLDVRLPVEALLAQEVLELELSGEVLRDLADPVAPAAVVARLAEE
eukprot:1404248-Alexandrium_andersonii.AAC.1